MPTEVLEATAVASYDAWTLGAGGNKTTAVQLPDDDSTSYIKANTNGQQETYTKDAVVGLIGSISDVSMGFRIHTAAGGYQVKYMLYDNPDTSYGTTRNPAAVWTQYNESAANHPSGSSWRAANLASCEMGIEVVTNGSWSSCTTLTLTVTFTPPLGIWTSMLLSVLGSVLGSNLQLSDMPALIAAFNRASRGKRIIRGHEAVEMYDDLKANAHPSFCFLKEAA